MNRIRRQHTNVQEVAKDALTGYAVIVLSLVIFILLLAAISIIVRLIIGASTGA